MAKETEATPAAEGGRGETPAAAQGRGEVAAPDSGRGEQVWWKAPDGTAFPTPKHLEEQWGKSIFTKADYTQKTQKFAEERKAFEDERKRFDLDRQEHLRRVAEHDSRAKQFEAFDRFVKQYPARYKAWAEEIKKGPGPDDIEARIQQAFEEKYGKKVEELDQWKAEREAAEARAKAYSALKSRYKDFDESAIEKAQEELIAKLQAGDYEYLAERLYLANRPAGHEEPTPEVIEQTKKNAELLPGTGKAPSATVKPPRDFAEARKRAMAGLKE